MERKNLRSRLLYPVAVVFLIMSVSWAVYNTAWRLDSRAAHQILAAVSGALMFASVVFGPLLIYPIAYFRGASVIERIAACLVNPLLWATKENLRLYISYSLPECLYYYLNPLSIALFFGVVAQMGLLEMLCRWRMRGTEQGTSVLSPGALAGLIVGLGMVAFLFTWGQGENAYVVFLEGYRKLFGSGL